MAENALRQLPSIDRLLRRKGLQPLIAEAGRERVRDRLREVMVELRQELANREGGAAALTDSQKLMAEIELRTRRRFTRHQRLLTQRVINATGVVLHTNLGRARLSRRALEAINEVAGDYCNLEYDLATGERGHRGSGLEATLSELLGSEAAAVVNNCAAAVLLTLNTLAEGGEVIVSRGELIEIGSSFRIPDVIAKSGARIREVGTTNRTYLRDYEQAINEQTRVILRASPSNYRIVGFTEKPPLAELARLARAHRLPLFEDLGAGSLIDLNPIGIHHESTVADSLQAGASIVTFSGDKLLGGPQAGIILGESELVKRIQSNPLMRALRVDKLTLAALEATFADYAGGRAREEVPTLAAIHLPLEAAAQRAQTFIRRAQSSVSGLRLKLIEGYSVVGGGCAPEAKLPTMLIGVSSERLSTTEIEAWLRQNDPPVIARIAEDQLMLDLRTVDPQGEEELITALGRLRA
ncbi:MAG TPA: L-seryl-tRNA(Sec) selenium transferase [Blastocatellia bacterium]|nr:L-seryl-tRNA(Sec) selenium transferase [Blastocatellia bacterium]